MRLFLDTSALAKQYVREPGSPEVRGWIAEADELVLSVLALPELISLFSRSRREGGISNEQYAVLKQNARRAIGEATIIQTTSAVIAVAIRCLERAPLRASDAIHIASALEAGVDRFVSADRRQCEAARVMGLRVEAVGQSA